MSMMKICLSTTNTHQICIETARNMSKDEKCIRSIFSLDACHRRLSVGFVCMLFAFEVSSVCAIFKYQHEILKENRIKENRE